MMKQTAFLILVALALTGAVYAQEPKSDEGAPPPLKVMAKTDRVQLDGAKDEKARVKLTIELAESHLTNVESKTTQQMFDVAAAEAGMYWALVDDVFNYLKSVQRDNNKKRDLYKRLELTLRAHGPRLSTVRRSTPSEYAVWIKEIEESARRGRTEALNSFYGHTVLRESTAKPDNQDPKKSPDKN